MPIEFLMPALSPTMTEGNLAKWLKKEGDTIESGDVVAEIETDKATMEVEAVDEGILGKILVTEGTENVAVNSVIALILEDGEDASALDGFSPSSAPAAAAEPAAAAPEPAPAAADPAPVTPAPAAPAPQAAASGGRIFASPLAKRLAAQEGLDLALLTGSGPKGRIVKRDIEAAVASGTGKAGQVAAVEAPAAAPAAAAAGPVDLTHMPAYREIPNSGMRKIVAKRLLQSKQTVPDYFLTVDCEIDKLLELRKELNSRSPEGDNAYKISVNDFVLKALALALHKFPAANAIWTDDAILQFEQVDVAVAVALDGGLITPVIRNASAKGLIEISQEVKDLVKRARAGTLAPEEYQGGTVSMSNLGMYGMKSFTAIINPPQGCILAIAAGEQRPVVKNGALAIATVMTCTLTVDHRLMDGALGAEFMTVLKPLIEDPIAMLL